MLNNFIQVIFTFVIIAVIFICLFNCGLTTIFITVITKIIQIKYRVKLPNCLSTYVTNLIFVLFNEFSLVDKFYKTLQQIKYECLTDKINSDKFWLKLLFSFFLLRGGRISFSTRRKIGFCTLQTVPCKILSFDWKSNINILSFGWYN